MYLNMIEKKFVSFYNILIIIKFFYQNITYVLCILIIYKVMLIINIIIPGKIEEWGFVLN